MKKYMNISKTHFFNVHAKGNDKEVDLILGPVIAEDRHKVEASELFKREHGFEPTEITIIKTPQ